MTAITPDDIAAARRRLAGHVRRTFAEPSDALSEMAGRPVWLKLEHHQHTGSFKFRGATNVVQQLPAHTPGVAAASTGNHGRALARAAGLAGLRAVICMSRLVPQNKRNAIAAEGAETRIVGDSQDDAQEEVARLVAQESLAEVPPFDDPRVIAGQGTIGAELVEDIPDLATAVIPVSGGGLVAGIAMALKAARPGVRVVGVSMARGAAMHASLRAGRPVAVEELATLADSLGGGIGLGNRHTFALVRSLVDEIVLLTEAEIAAGVRHCYEVEREVVEGGGAAGVAAILAGKVRAGGPVAVLLSGRNIDMALHRRLVHGDPTALPGD